MFFMTIYLYLYLHLIWGDFLTSNFLNHLQSSIHLPIILSSEVYDEFMSLEPEVRQAPYGMSNTWFFTWCIFLFFLLKNADMKVSPSKKIHWSSDMSCVVLSCFVQMSFITMANPPRKSAGGVAWYSLSTAQKFKMEPQKTMVSKRNLLFAGLIFRFHVVNHRWFLCWDWKHPRQELTEFLNADGLEERGFLLYLGWRQIWVDKFHLQP